uniref:Uncharacterized protein n=1 Tax=Utricularia reniformis TaxID=192314 RepID=A0A1Y0B2F7_9LAMI|nr:hypothetical protein AEK19_MT1384 [Utricularia reniformis]ART31580.1 hypothetical protein AEK19_MT1384 [Utricularia reniformis]
MTTLYTRVVNFTRWVLSDSTALKRSSKAC